MVMVRAAVPSPVADDIITRTWYLPARSVAGTRSFTVRRPADGPPDLPVISRNARALDAPCTRWRNSTRHVARAGSENDAVAHGRATLTRRARGRGAVGDTPRPGRARVTATCVVPVAPTPVVAVTVTVSVPSGAVYDTE